MKVARIFPVLRGASQGWGSNLGLWRGLDNDGDPTGAQNINPVAADAGDVGACEREVFELAAKLDFRQRGGDRWMILGY